MAITTNNLISRQTVGSAGAATVTFSNIPQTFTDLRIVVSARSTNSANDNFLVIINGSTSTIYSTKLLYGSGTAAASANSGYNTFIYPADINGTATTASVFSNGEIYIPNYGSANYKSMSVDSVLENNATAGYDYLSAGLWASTAAITSITLRPANANFAEFTTFSLYGISSNTSTQNTSVPSATGGDVITTDGTYWYHQFLYSGTFTPLKALTADYLVVAGGGGGGNALGGGGGAGGFKTSTGLSLTTQAYTCTIGGGGAGASNTNGTVYGANGSNSVFSTITSTGGGVGGNSQGAGVKPGIAGGSGGGGSNGGAGGAATPSGEGSAGGAGEGVVNGSGGGGGGASAVGANANTSTGAAGVGGAGTSNSYSGSAVTYAGGGGGGGGMAGAAANGGSGGGGNGSLTIGSNGTANLGGGGGGGGGSTTNAPPFAVGGNGGSGIVLIRYVV